MAVTESVKDQTGADRKGGSQDKITVLESRGGEKKDSHSRKNDMKKDAAYFSF